MKSLSRRLLVAVAVLAAGFALPAQAALPAALQGEDGERPSLAPLVDDVSPAVVNISTEGTVQREDNPLMQHPFFRRFFDMPEQGPQQRRMQSLGSGVIVDAQEGYIITNHHVVANADTITVGLQDNREFQAEVIGSDPDTDIAVIRIDADDLEAVELGNSDDLRIGDFVLALGNPFGLEHTVTSGIVSGLGRSLSGQRANARIQDFIQTDASINPGNSGGALVDLNGELVGINTAILSRSGGNIGIGFAVPVNMVEVIMDQLIEHGEVRRGLLGVQAQNLSRELARAMDMSDREGALVARVVEDSAAREAGLQEGDVITAVGDQAVTNASDLARLIGLRQVGDEVTLTVIRDGAERTLTATLGSASEAKRTAGASGPIETGPLAGATLEASDALEGRSAPAKGVVVTEVQEGSAAADHVRPGDVILSVNRTPVRSPEPVHQASADSDRLLLHLRRGNAGLFVLAD